MLLVSGGHSGTAGGRLDTTEVRAASGSWRVVAGLLPIRLTAVRVAVVDNIPFLIGLTLDIYYYGHNANVTCLGGYDENEVDHDEIYQYNNNSETWSLAGHTVHSRRYHAVATIHYQDVRYHCNNPWHSFNAGTWNSGNIFMLVSTLFLVTNKQIQTF